jgi:hypothetical protein
LKVLVGLGASLDYGPADRHFIILDNSAPFETAWTWGMGDKNDAPPGNDPLIVAQPGKQDQAFFLNLAVQGKDAWNAWRRAQQIKTNTYEHVVSFDCAIFGSNPDFSCVTFGDYALFEDAVFGEYADFTGAAFGYLSNFERAHFGRHVNFSGLSLADPMRRWTAASALAEWSR